MDKEVVFYNLFYLVQTAKAMDQKTFFELGNHYSRLGKTGEELRSNQDIFTGIKTKKIRPGECGTEIIIVFSCERSTKTKQVVV